MWSSKQEPTQLTDRDFQQFYFILLTAVEKDKPEPTSSLYFKFVSAAIDPENKSVFEKEALLQRIEELKQQGLFVNNIDPKKLQLIIKDIEENGAFIHGLLARSLVKDPAHDFLMNLQQHQYRASTRDMLISIYFKQGEQLLFEGDRQQAIAVFFKAIDVDNANKLDKVDNHSLGAAQVEQENPTLVAIRRKLSLALTEHAMQTIKNIKISPEEFNSVITNLEVAMFQLEVISEKTIEDRQRIFLISRQIEVVRAAHAFKQGLSLFHEGLFTQSIDQFLLAIGMYQNIPRKDEAEKEFLNDCYRCLSKVLCERGKENGKSYDAALADFKEALEAANNINPPSESDSINISEIRLLVEKPSKPIAVPKEHQSPIIERSSPIAQRPNVVPGSIKPPVFSRTTISSFGSQPTPGSPLLSNFSAFRKREDTKHTTKETEEEKKNQPKKD